MKPKKPRPPHSASIRARSEPKVHMLMRTLAELGLPAIYEHCLELTLCQHWGYAVGWRSPPVCALKLSHVTCKGCRREAEKRPMVRNTLHSAEQFHQARKVELL